MSVPVDAPTEARHLRLPADAPLLPRGPVHRRPSRRWMAVYASLLVTALVAAAVLSYLGVETVRQSRAGQSVATSTDPALPGYEALLEPTPTLVVLHAEAGTLPSIAIIALRSNDEGGGVLLVPPTARINDDVDAFPLSFLAAYGNPPQDVVPSLQNLLGIGISETVVVNDERWAELVAPVAPIAIDNPDAVGEFPLGPLLLSAVQVGPYLAARNEGESELARLFRQQLFFEAWADAVAASGDPDAVPGEVDSGIGRFVRGLAAGPRQIATLPVTETLLPDGTRLDADAAALDELLPVLVPYPTASRPGRRVRVRLLDGTGDSTHVQDVAPSLVPAGSEIVVVGNADRFDYDTTEIRYHDPVRKQAARRLRDALGVGRIIDDARPTDAFDVTIVLGTDV